MSAKKVWFCPNCGYEVTSRGRCFRCKERLVASPLPELDALEEEDEVGYRLEDWDDAGRGRLIVALIRANVLHRFDGDELVVEAEDEDRVDDLLAELAAVLAAERPAEEESELEVLPEDGDSGDESEEGPEASAGEGAQAAYEPEAGEWSDEELAAARAVTELLYSAAVRLEQDPTDMQADGDVAEASAGVFSTESIPGMRADTWAAVGRTTRKLLAALGADEALEDEIKAQAGALVSLLGPVIEPSSEDGSAAAGEIAYELPDWSSEQRQALTEMLEEQGIGYSWDGPDLVVAGEHEPEVDAIFDAIGEGQDGADDGGRARYRALEELFAAADRLANDPTNASKRAEAAAAVEAADGGTPFGMSDVEWWQLRARARGLAAAIAEGAAAGRVHEDAEAVRDLLRSIV